MKTDATGLISMAARYGMCCLCPERFDFNVASMRFDKRLGQTETQSISADRAAPISTIESIKDMGKIVLVDPDASVRHGNLYVRPFVFD